MFCLRGKLLIVFAHQVDHRIGDLRQEGLLEADFAAKANRPSNHNARNGGPSLGARQHAVANQKDRRAGMIGNHAIGDDVRIPLFVGMAGKLLRLFDNRHKEVSLIVGLHALQNRQNSLQAHAGIDPGRWQRLVPLAAVFRVGLTAVELHKDQIPDFQEAVVLRLQHGNNAVFAHLRMIVPMNF